MQLTGIEGCDTVGARSQLFVCLRCDADAEEGK